MMLFAVRTKMTYMGNIMEKNIVSIWSGKNKNEKNIKPTCELPEPKFEYMAKKFLPFSLTSYCIRGIFVSECSKSAGPHPKCERNRKRYPRTAMAICLMSLCFVN